MPKEKSWAPLLLWASLLKGCNGWTSLGTTLGPTSSAPCNQNEIKNENHSFSPQLPHTHRLLPLALLSLYYFIDWASVGTGARRCTAPYFPGITLELASLPAVCGVKLKSSLSSFGTTQLQHCGRPKVRASSTAGLRTLGRGRVLPLRLGHRAALPSDLTRWTALLAWACLLGRERA